MVQSTVVEHLCKKCIIAPLLSVVLYLPKTPAEIINQSQVHKKAQH